MPRARHLAQVLAQHEFQEALKNYRDLRFLARNLDEWREKLGVFDDMLATRRKAFADRLPLVRERQQQIDVEALVKRREAARRRGRRAARRPATASPSPTPSSSTCSRA